MQRTGPMQLGKLIYHRWLSNMKFTLDLDEQKYQDGRNDSRFKFFKKLLMENTYKNMRELFEQLEELDVLEKTKNNEDLKNGYQETPSGGSGYVNTEEFDEWLNYIDEDYENSVNKPTDEEDENIGNSK